MVHRSVAGLAKLGVASLAALLSVGCVSDSIGSLSDSASSPFEWSSSISGGAAGAYRNDIREQTLSFLESGGSIDGFRREISSVAERHGVLDWEAEPASFEALGEGLRAAGVEGGQLESLAGALTGGNTQRLRALRNGYEREHPERAS